MNKNGIIATEECVQINYKRRCSSCPQDTGNNMFFPLHLSICPMVDIWTIICIFIFLSRDDILDLMPYFIESVQSDVSSAGQTCAWIACHMAGIPSSQHRFCDAIAIGHAGAHVFTVRMELYHQIMDRICDAPWRRWDDARIQEPRKDDARHALPEGNVDQND